MPQPTPSATLDARLLRFRHDPATEDMYALARELLVADRAVDALEVTGVGLRMKPTDGALLVLDGQARLKQGDLIRAQSSLLKAARVSPEDSSVFRWLGEVLLRRGDPERAAKVLERAVQLTPHNQELRALHHRATRLSSIVEAETRAPEADSSERAKRARPGASEPRVGASRTESHASTGAPRNAHVAGPSLASAAARPLRVFAPGGTLRGDARGGASVGGAVGGAERSSEVVNARPQLWAPRSHVSDPTTAQVATPFDDDALTSIRPQPTDALGALPLDEVTHAVRNAPSLDDEPVTSAYRTDLQPPRQDATEPRVRTEAPAGLRREEPTPLPSVSMRPSPAPAVRVRVEVQPPEEPTPAPPQRVSISPRSADAWAYDRASDDAAVELLHSYPEGRDNSASSRRGKRDEWEAVTSTPFFRTAVGKTLLGAFTAVFVLAGVGYWQWTQWVERRHRLAEALVQKSRDLGRNGSHEALVAAERELRRARELNRRNTSAMEELLYVQSQRALEEGSYPPGFLRATLSMASRHRVRASALQISRAVIGVSDGAYNDVEHNVSALLRTGSDDPRILYFVARLEQSLNAPEGMQHLKKSLELKGAMASAFIAFAEQLYEKGQTEDSIGLLNRLLQTYPGHLRTRAWLVFLRSEDDTASSVQQELSLLEKDIAKAAPTDRALMSLARLRLWNRKTTDPRLIDAEVQTLLRLNLSAPRLLALIAHETANSASALARRVADECAMRAVHLAPREPTYRTLAAEIALAQQNPQKAVALVASLPANDPDVLSLRARAALAFGSNDALQQARQAVDAWVNAHSDVDAGLRALHYRLMIASGASSAGEARAEALRQLRVLGGSGSDVDEDVIAQLADAELQLDHYDEALQAYRRLLGIRPSRADYHYGIARGLWGGDPPNQGADPKQVEQALLRAVELAPGHAPAQLALGQLYALTGRWKEATSSYAAVSDHSRLLRGAPISMWARVGTVEVLLATGKAEQAKQELASVPQSYGQHAEVRLAVARTALALGQSEQAVRELRGVLEKGLGDAPSSRDIAVRVYTALGQALIASKQWDRAHDAIKSALERDASNPEALVTRAKLAVHDNRAGAALEYLELAQKSFARRWRPARQLADVVLFTGQIRLSQSKTDWEHAAKLFKQATEMKDASPDAHFFLGEALAKLNRSAEARSSYETYLALDPNGLHAARAASQTKSGKSK